MELELLSQEKTLPFAFSCSGRSAKPESPGASSKLCSLNHTRKWKDLGLAVLTPYLMWPKTVLPVLLRNLEADQVPDPTGRDAAWPCALRARALAFESRFSGEGSLRSRAICWHALYETNTGVWVTRERLFKESKYNLLHWRQRPYMLCVFAFIVLCICFSNYAISLPFAHHDLIGFKCRVVAYGLNVSGIIINEN